MQRIAMKETTQLLAELRKIFQKTQEKIAAYIVPSDDAHNSEYICPHDERRAFISGFTGSAGTAVITNEKALLWTDGRYYQQAGQQLDSNWTLMRDGLPTTPRIGAWLAKSLPKGSKIGFDPKLISYRAWQPIKTDLEANECDLIAIEGNLIDMIWNNQPCRPKKPIITLDLSFSGQTVKDKWDQVRKDMNEKNVDCVVVSALDEVAWFLNMRGDDIGYNPVFFAYLIITHVDIMLFVDSSQLPNDFKEHQEKNQVKINVLDYDYIKVAIKNIESSTEKKIWIAPTYSYFLNILVPKKKLHQEITSICLMKAVKNPTECEGFIQSHIRDGVALCQYFAWLEQALKNGEYVDEISGATKLEEFRSTKDHFKGISFSTISSSGPNGSVIHYHPTPETNRQIVPKEIYLCDSGAQYLDGTTDVTRTMHFGDPTDFQKEAYTRVLKGQLTFAATIFPKKVKGQVLDTLARKALWDIGLDYGHGTGHGVGHFLNVHEGPMGCGIRLMPDDPGLQEYMFISNEPGYYKDGEFGLRIEDIVQIIEVKPQFDFSGRGALGFRTITMCPKQTKMIKKELLTDAEMKQLNDYHKEVWNTLSPILEKDGDILTLEWLKKETAPI